MRQSQINLDIYINKEDLDLLRNKKTRCKAGDYNIVMRSLELVRLAKEDKTVETKTGNMPARDYLFLLHTPIMRCKLNRWFKINPMEFDQYLSWCFDSFVQSINSFDENKSNNFIYLMTRNLWNYFINLYKSKEMRKLKLTSSLDSLKEINEFGDERYLKDIDEEIFKIDENEQLKRGYVKANC